MIRKDLACAKSLKTQAEGVVVQFRTRKICFLVSQKGNVPIVSQVLEKTDRTVVTTNTDKQKVEVYKINLDKQRGIGVCASNQSYGAMMQYRNIVGFGGPKYQGGYEVGIGYMIRF